MVGTNASRALIPANGNRHGEQKFVSVFMETLQNMDPPLTLPFLQFVDDWLVAALKHAIPGQDITIALMAGLRDMKPSPRMPFLYFLVDFLTQAIAMVHTPKKAGT